MATSNFESAAYWEAQLRQSGLRPITNGDSLGLTHAPRGVVAFSLDSVIAEVDHTFSMRAPTVEDQADTGMPLLIDDMLPPLTEYQKTVIDIRFGRDRGEPRTLGEAAELLGITREQLRQTETRALASMRSSERLSLAGWAIKSLKISLE